MGAAAGGAIAGAGLAATSAGGGEAVSLAPQSPQNLLVTDWRHCRPDRRARGGRRTHHRTSGRRHCRTGIDCTASRTTLLPHAIAMSVGAALPSTASRPPGLLPRREPGIDRQRTADAANASTVGWDPETGVAVGAVVGKGEQVDGTTSPMVGARSRLDARSPPTRGTPRGSGASGVAGGLPCARTEGEARYVVVDEERIDHRRQGIEPRSAAAMSWPQ